MDQLKDRNHQRLWKLSQLLDIPEFVKQSTPLASADDLPASTFADTAGRAFPCPSRAETFVSYMYFLDGKDEIPLEKQSAIHRRLRHFARIWNISNMCDNLEKSFTKLAENPDPVDDDFALVTEHKGQKIRRFQIRNADTVKVAAQYLFNNRGAYPYRWRKTAAQNILRKASEFNVVIEPNTLRYIEQAAGNGTSPNIKIGESLCYRACMLRSEDGTTELMGKIAETAQHIINSSPDPLSHEKLEKVAEIIAAIDEEFKWNRLYKEGMATPEEICFGFTLKTAEQIKAAHVRLTTGSLYKLGDLANVPRRAFEAALPDTLIDSLFDNDKTVLIKLSTILPTLSRSDAAILERALHSAGINSVNNEPADLQEMAVL